MILCSPEINIFFFLLELIYVSVQIIKIECQISRNQDFQRLLVFACNQVSKAAKCERLTSASKIDVLVYLILAERLSSIKSSFACKLTRKWKAIKMNFSLDGNISGVRSIDKNKN